MKKRKRLLQRIIALALVAALMWQTDSMRFFSTAYAAESEMISETDISAETGEDEDMAASEAVGEAYVLEELTDKRTKYSKEFLLSNGFHMVTLYGEAVHYEKNGQWADIDNTLKVSAIGDENYYINTAGSVQVRFPQTFSDEKGISVTKEGKTISFYMTGEIKSVKVSTAVMQSDLLSSAEGQDSLAQYAVHQKNQKPSESIIIERYDASILGYTYLLKTEGLVPVLMDSGEIRLTDALTGEAVMAMPAPFMVDDAGEFCYDVELTLEPSDAGYVLTYHLPQEWLADMNRQWPVVLDPAVTTNLSLDNIEDQTVYSISYRADVVDTESIGILQCVKS